MAREGQSPSVIGKEQDHAQRLEGHLLDRGRVDSFRKPSPEGRSRLLPQVSNLLSDVPRDLSQAESFWGGVSSQRLPHAEGDRRSDQAETGLVGGRSLRAHVAGNGVSERPALLRTVRNEHEV